MSEVVGKATLVADADVSGLRAAFGQAKQDVGSFGTAVAAAGKQAGAGMDGVGAAAGRAVRQQVSAERRFLASLEREAQAAGRLRSEYLQLRADQFGGDVAAKAAPYIARLKELEGANNGLAMSARQTAAAMRMVPAQFTDIITQLAGGQSPLLILTQQGGQLKDMFGGIGPAARALGVYISGLITPVTLAGAAVAALAAGATLGAMELDRYNKSLALTGDFAGISAAGLGDAAARIGDVVGTVGGAADALNKLVATGRITGRVIEEIGLAAVDMRDATGQSVDETIKVFERLADSPSQAIAKLNEQQHFLTLAVYDQIRALEEQGRTQEAAELAQRTYAQTLRSQANAVRESMGTLERTWNSLASAARAAWDAMLNIGRGTPTAELESQAERVQAQISRLQFSGGFTTTESGAAFGDPRLRARELRRLSSELAEIQEELNKRNASAFTAGVRAEAAAANERKITIRTEIDELIKSGRTKEQVRESELRKLRSHLSEGLITQQQFNDASKAIAERYKDAAGPKTTDSEATRTLLTLQQQAAALQAQLDSNQKLTDQQRQLAQFEQQIADLKNKSVLTADQKSLLANEASLRAQLQKNVEIGNELRLKQEGLKIDAMSRSLQESLATDRQQYGDQLAAVGLGTRAQDQLRSRQQLNRDYQRQIQQLARQQASGDILPETYQTQTQLLRDNLQARIEVQDSYYQALNELQRDWRVGALSGLADYADEAQNAAATARSAFSTGLQGIEDFGVGMVTKLKLNFRDLGKTAISILDDISRHLIRQNVTGPLAGFLGAAVKGLIGGISVSDSYVDSGVALGGAGGGGDTLSGFLSGARANGGGTAPNSLYEVNERGPELYTEAGRTFLMSGPRGGFVTPLTSAPVAQGKSGIRVTLNNYGGADVQVRQMNDHELMVEVDRRIARQTPRAMRSEYQRPNSLGARALADNYNVTRKR